MCWKDHKWCIGAAVVVLLVILLVIGRAEGFLDQMADRHPDPALLRYTGMERDVSGMSMRDYFLENQRQADNEAAPYLQGKGAFADNTDYLTMPLQYRPKPSDENASAAAVKAEPRAAAQENAAMAKMAKEGMY